MFWSLPFRVSWAGPLFPEHSGKILSLSRGADVDLHICMFLASDEIRRCIFNQSLQRGWALGGKLEGGRGNVTTKRVWVCGKETLRTERCLWSWSGDGGALWLADRAQGGGGLGSGEACPAPALAVCEPPGRVLASA